MSHESPSGRTCPPESRLAAPRRMSEAIRLCAPTPSIRSSRESLSWFRGCGRRAIAPFPAAEFSTGSGPVWAVVADFDGDGHPDVATADDGSIGVTVLLGNGAGSFGPPARLPCRPIPPFSPPAISTATGCPISSRRTPTAPYPYSWEMAAASLRPREPRGRREPVVDRDRRPRRQRHGRPRRHLARRDRPRQRRRESIAGKWRRRFRRAGAARLGIHGLLGRDRRRERRRQGRHRRRRPIAEERDRFVGKRQRDLRHGMGNATGSSAHVIALGDLNGDGAPDLIACERESRRRRVRIVGKRRRRVRRGQGLFRWGAPRSLVVADLDGDGKLDAATANSGTSNVSLLFGDGAGGFGPTTFFAVGLSPSAIAAGDLNGDGKPDLVTSNLSTDTITVALATGSGAFAVGARAAVGAIPRAVVAGDLDSDGRPDLVTVNLTASSVSVLLGTGSLGLGAVAFAPPRRRPRPPSPPASRSAISTPTASPTSSRRASSPGTRSPYCWDWGRGLRRARRLHEPSAPQSVPRRDRDRRSQRRRRPRRGRRRRRSQQSGVAMVGKWLGALAAPAILGLGCRP